MRETNLRFGAIKEPPAWLGTMMRAANTLRQGGSDPNSKRSNAANKKPLSFLFTCVENGLALLLI